MFALLTFADCARPPVLNVLKEKGVSEKECFSFNNCAFFAEGNRAKRVEDFWNFGIEGFKDLLSQNWLKPPSSDGKEKNPYQFL